MGVWIWWFGENQVAREYKTAVYRNGSKSVGWIGLELHKNTVLKGVELRCQQKQNCGSIDAALLDIDLKK